MTRLILALSATAFAVGCSGASAAPPSPEEREVEEAVRALYADLSARSWESLAARFAEGATFNGTRRGKLATQPIADFLAESKQSLAKAAVFEERCLDVKVRVHPGVAQAWSRFEGRVGPSEDKVRTWTGIDAWTLVRVDGRWKVTSVAVGVD